MFIDGAYRILYIDSGSGYYPVGCLTNNSFSEESEIISTTTRDNEGWNTSRATNQSYSILFEGLVLDADIVDNTQTYYDLKTIKRGRTLINWKIDNTDSGSGIITSLSDDNGIDKNVSFSAEIVGYGKPLILLDVIINDYINRAVADGGLSVNDNCLKKYIDSIN